MEILVFYVPFPSQEAASEALKALLELRCIACGQVIPAQSAYWWEGSIEQGAEWVAILKTTAEQEMRTEKYLLDTHPYDLPALVRLKATVNRAYYEWMKTVISG